MAQTEDDKKILSSNFKVEVKGIGFIEGVTEVDAGRVTVAICECSQGDQPEYRTYTYGDPAFEALTMTVQQGPGTVALQNWHDGVGKKGADKGTLRRDISIYLMARDGSTVLRTINCHECFPTQFSAGGHSTGSDVKCMTLTSKIAYVTVA
jgi:hypothetical protein